MRIETFSQAKEMADYWVSHNLTMRDGVTLRYGIYSAAKPTSGRVLILMDQDEFIEKYSEVAEDFAARGWQVWCLEWRGQGRIHTQIVEEVDDADEPEVPEAALPSSPTLTPVKSVAPPKEKEETKARVNNRQRHETPNWFELCQLDLEELWRHVWYPEARKAPAIILAHGIGGHIVLRWLVKHGDRTIGRTSLILSAPMLRPWPVSVSITLVRVIATVMCLLLPTFPYPGQNYFRNKDKHFSSNRMTRDKIRYRIIQMWRTQYPELAAPRRSWNWLVATLNSCIRLHKSFLMKKNITINLPTLALITPSDRMIDGRSQFQISEKIEYGQVVEFAEAEHDLWHERDETRDQVWQEVDAFIAKVRAGYSGLKT